jgi:hypothetical protein
VANFIAFSFPNLMAHLQTTAPTAALALGKCGMISSINF